MTGPGDVIDALNAARARELAEDEAVAQYEESIEMCRAAADEESRTLFERILAEERAHARTFRDLLKERS